MLRLKASHGTAQVKRLRTAQCRTGYTDGDGVMMAKDVVMWEMDATNPWCRWVGAGDEIRTHDPNHGKVVLYQLSYARVSPGHLTTGLKVSE